jgi:hypothetical protein
MHVITDHGSIKIAPVDPSCGRAYTCVAGEEVGRERWKERQKERAHIAV